MAALTGGTADTATQITVTFDAPVDASTVSGQGDWTVEPVTSGVAVAVLSAAVAGDLLSVVLTLYPRLTAGVDYLVTAVDADITDISLTNEADTPLTDEALNPLTTG